MTALTRRATILTAAALVGAGVAGASVAAPAQKAAQKAAQKPTATPAPSAVKAAPGDMSIGNPNAPIHVIEYLSLTCPHCAHFHADVFPQFKAKYIDTGKVYFTIRELLTAPAQVAAAGFLLARCDGGKSYFKIVDEVFKSQSRWQPGSIKPIFVEIAKKNGLTEEQFDACVTSDTAQDDLGKRLDYATKVDKVTGTPAFFVNGVAMNNETVPTLADLDAAIAKALKSGALKGGRR